MNNLKLGERMIPLYFSTAELKDIQEEVGSIFQIRELLTQNAWSNEQIDNLVKVTKILGNAGLEENGQAADLTEKWIMRHMNPLRMQEVVNAIMMTIAEGMRMETAEEEAGEVDVTLQEIKKKESE